MGDWPRPVALGPDPRYAGRMTHAQTPYQPSDVNMYQEPERTSVMAILSLVLGILGCCTGVTSLLAIPLGVFALIGISRSNGRVGGTGLGIAGIIVGLLTLALWIGLIFGIGGAMKTSMGSFTATVEGVLSDIQADRFDEARADLASPAADVPDELMIEFRDAYQASLGDYVSQPTTMGEWWSGYMAVGQQIQQNQGQQGVVPLPLRFDNGWALVIYEMDMSGGPNNAAGIPRATELIIVDSQGNEFRLPPEGSVPPAPGAPAENEADSDEGDQMPTGDPADDVPVEDEGP